MSSNNNPKAVESADALNRRLHEAFSCGSTRSYEWRAAQLRAMMSLLDDNEAALHDALRSDLGKSPFESDMTELHLVRNSIEYMLQHLRAWLNPSSPDATAALPWYLSAPGSKARIVPEPLGVALIIGPWNFPILLTLDPLVAAIAAGNAAALKLSEVSPATSALMASLLPQYLDNSAIGVVTGGPDASIALLEQRWDKIFYTGNPVVGRYVMAAAAKHLTPVTLELGGKCATLIDSSADVVLAARRIASGKWAMNAGQTCIAPDYVLVERKVSAAFVEALKKSLLDFGFDADGAEFELPHIINKAHLGRLISMRDEALGGGATQVTWRQKSGNGAGTDIGTNVNVVPELFMEPTILLNPPFDSRVMTEEIFGPILPVLEVDDIMDDGMAIVKSKSKPLALYVFSNKLACKVSYHNNKNGNSASNFLKGLIPRRATTTNTNNNTNNNANANTNTTSGGGGGGGGGGGSEHRVFVEHDKFASSGALVLNDVVNHFALPNLPFGGVGGSGMGAYHGRFGFDAFSHRRPVIMFAGDDPIRYPPYSSKTQALMAALQRNQTLQFFRLRFFGSSSSSPPSS